MQTGVASWNLPFVPCVLSAILAFASPGLSQTENEPIPFLGNSVETPRHPRPRHFRIADTNRNPRYSSTGLLASCPAGIRHDYTTSMTMSVMSSCWATGADCQRRISESSCSDNSEGGRD